MTLRKLAAAALALAIPASAAMAYAPSAVPRPNLVEIADTAGNFHMLLTAANNAGVLAELVNPLDRVTVLAPTDEAFAKLPRGTFEYLMLPQNRDKLADLVRRHIVPGAVLSSQFGGQSLTLPTLAGSTVTLEGDTASGAKMDYKDVIGSNGVIHVIDQVLVPTT